MSLDLGVNNHIYCKFYFFNLGRLWSQPEMIGVGKYATNNSHKSHRIQLKCHVFQTKFPIPKDQIMFVYDLLS